MVMHMLWGTCAACDRMQDGAALGARPVAPQKRARHGAYASRGLAGGSSGAGWLGCALRRPASMHAHRHVCESARVGVCRVHMHIEGGVRMRMPCARVVCRVHVHVEGACAWHFDGYVHVHVRVRGTLMGACSCA